MRTIVSSWLRRYLVDTSVELVRLREILNEAKTIRAKTEALMSECALEPNENDNFWRTPRPEQDKRRSS